MNIELTTYQWIAIAVAVICSLIAGIVNLMDKMPNKKENAIMQDKPSTNQIKWTTSAVSRYGCSGNVNPNIAACLAQKTCLIELRRIVKIEIRGEVIFDISQCQTRKFCNNTFYVISGYEEEFFYISDDPTDSRIWHYSSNPDIRAFYPVEQIPSKFDPWPEYETLDAYLYDQLSSRLNKNLTLRKDFYS